MSTEVAAILTAAKALIATPDKWTQGAYARDAAGERVLEFSQDATCWCGDGAIRHAVRQAIAPGVYVRGTIHEASLSALEAAAGTLCFFGWNDRPGRTHAEVMEVFDRAIAAEAAKS